MEGSNTPVKDFYNGKTIFITGSSGFMGKVLVEKLLYGCPGIKNIYALIRPKKGNTVTERMDIIANLPMFARLRESQPNAFKKIIPLNGDVLADNLGLSDTIIKKLHSEVDIVFHCAATLRLEAQLKDAIDMNTTGTWRVIQICKNMVKLQVFVHLSTAFCYADYDVLPERVLEWPDSPANLMEAIKWIDNESLIKMTPTMLKVHPNTYTYSKRLAESLITDEYKNMRVCIARPSIVSPAWEEPVPGWVDNLNGPIGLMVGAGKGVIRSMHCNGEFRAQVIPVDFAINALVVMGYTVATMETMPPEIPVYNLTITDSRDIKWKDVLEYGRNSIKKYPFESPLWYPDGSLRTNIYMHNLCVFFFHIIPAYFIDFLMLIFRQKRFMVRIQRRISDGLDVLQFFTTREWHFESNNFMKLYDNLTEDERSNFEMSFSVVDHVSYIDRCLLGGRVYCLKEPLSSLPRARTVNNILYYVDRICTIAFYAYLIWTIYYYSKSAGLLKYVPVLNNFISSE